MLYLPYKVISGPAENDDQCGRFIWYGQQTLEEFAIPRVIIIANTAYFPFFDNDLAWNAFFFSMKAANIRSVVRL